MEKDHVDRNAHAQIRTSQVSLGLASGALALTLVMSGFYVADTITGDTNLRNVLATLGFCEVLEPKPSVNPPVFPDTSKPGSDGQDGIDGSSGTDGATGESGESGAAGQDGSSGVDGVDGAAGSAGSPGEAGATGVQGPAGTQGPAGPCTYLLDLALIDGNLIPSEDNRYTLGSSEFRWKDLQLGPGTLFIEDPVTGDQVAMTVNDGSLLLDGADSLRIGNIRLTATGIESILADQDITIGNLGDTGYVVLARGLKFPDGTIQSTAAGGGSTGPEGPAGPPGPQGDPGSVDSFVEQAACVEGKDGAMIGPIKFGTCLENKKVGTDITVLMKVP
jgi:hypothetical protein